ncbi:serine/arginine repetitive matrix protein 1-like isoform X1 [Atheta coriaria]
MVHVNINSRNLLYRSGGTNCLDCDINFTSEEYLIEHLLRHHIKQPKVILERHTDKPIKLRIKGSKGEGFRIVTGKSPAHPKSKTSVNGIVENEKEPTNFETSEVSSDAADAVNTDANLTAEEVPQQDAMQNIDFQDTEEVVASDEKITYGMTENVPGGEPTPPPDNPTPEIPKIRIKTGLLATDPNPGHELIEEVHTPGTLENSESLTSLFKNNDRAKDLGFTTSDPDYVPQDAAMQSYNPASNAMMAKNSLASISNIPMQELAQQVSRLQNGLQTPNGMHQQNVLINIQHFQQPQPPVPHNVHNYPVLPPIYPQQSQPQAAPPPPTFQHNAPPRYHYPSGGHMYYQPPPPPGYPHPQHNQRPQNQMGPPVPPGPPRQPTPCIRYPPQNQMMHLPINHRSPRGRPSLASQSRPTAPMQQRTRQPRPRMPILQQTLATPPPTKQNVKPMKRSRSPVLLNGQNQMKINEMKKMKMDTLVPDKNDDADCEVVAVTQKSSSLPQIQSIQGNVSDPNTMHLSESITLTTIQPSISPKQKEARAEAKEVASVLAARGITVTTAPRNKDSASPLDSSGSNTPVSINLNSAVCIIPQKKKDDAAPSPTVDLTDDVNPPGVTPSQPTTSMKPPQPKIPTGTQQYECHMCISKFPSVAMLIKHRKTYHRTNVGPEFGIPLIDLKSPGVTQRLTKFGIFHYIPLPNTNSGGMFALPILSVDAQNTTNPQDFASSILTLGPIKPINPPRPVIKRGKPPNNNVSTTSYNSS